FTATNATTPLVFRGLPNGVRLDDVVLTEVITNAPLVYTRFTEDTNLALLPLKFASAPYATNTLFIPISETGFEATTGGPGDYVAVSSVEDGWQVLTNVITTNSSAVIADASLAFADRHFMALADGRLALTNLPTTPGVEYNFTLAYRDNGILSWWPGDQSSGDVMELNNGTFVSPVYAAGLVRDAFRFNGTAPRRVTLGDPTSLQLVGAFSVEGWVNVTSLPVGAPAVVFGRGDNAGNFPYLVGVRPTGELLFRIEANSSNRVDLVGPAVSLNSWVHFGAVMNHANGNMRLLVNGVEVGSTNTILRPALLLDPAANPEVAIGGHPSAAVRPLNGLVDELTVHGRALSRSEIGAVFRAGANGKPGAGNLPEPEPIIQVVINGLETNTLAGARLWAEETFSTVATSNVLSLEVIGTAHGMLIDSLTITETRSFNHYLAEELLEPFVGENAGGEWTLTVWDNR
ncbi:MAG TPA: hypothetical protein DCY13_06900, partial [Verrucomicrobiales bacterium]|nr:hypothetical protein [Verrucomicrobiales bacterium]